MAWILWKKNSKWHLQSHTQLRMWGFCAYLRLSGDNRKCLTLYRQYWSGGKSCFCSICFCELNSSTVVMWHCMNGKYLNDVFAIVRIKHSTYMMLLLMIFRDRVAAISQCISWCHQRIYMKCLFFWGFVFLRSCILVYCIWLGNIVCLS